MPVRVRHYILPDGIGVKELPSLEDALLFAYRENCSEDRAAEVEVLPGLWYSPYGSRNTWTDGTLGFGTA